MTPPVTRPARPFTTPQPVVIVGCGPVGLGAALELARFGVPSVVLERRMSPSRHPKTRNFNTRTMEIARGWGPAVYGRLRAIDTPDGWKSPIRFFDTVVGKEFGHIDSKGFEGPGPEVSPSLPVMSSQDLLTEILRDAAAATGLVEFRFGHRVTELASGSDELDTKAVVQVADEATGESYTLSGAALVAADGVDSFIRGALGVRLEGEQAIHHFVNCYFHSPIEPHVGERTGVLLYVANPDAIGVLQPLDANGRWLCQISVPPEQWNRKTWTDARVQNWVRAAVGVSDLEVDVRSVGTWRMNVTVAERLAFGRVVLCGDAAHQFPPTGGLGVNTGLQGMHNAMWKLALCVRGLADWSLLDTYDIERRPPARRTADQSYENFRNVARMGAAAYGFGEDLDPDAILRETRRYGNHLGVEFGTAYDSAAIVPDGTRPPTVDDDYSDYAPGATPGCRAPHVPLGPDGLLSTLDLFGPGFTVLTGPDSGAWRDASAKVGRELWVPVSSYTIGAPGLTDPSGLFLERYGITPEGAVLVRPDGYVGWRSASGTANGAKELTEAIERILGLRDY
ncbi:FAD-dependent monooxygenase [Streptomyces sp. NPDC001833]|uniref:FAD-dependent monooxygenase n=1 Tax=Streptomyces sp. NPDC001833 TaxID=3154658 RepID=UPI003321A200